MMKGPLQVHFQPGQAGSTEDLVASFKGCDVLDLLHDPHCKIAKSSRKEQTICVHDNEGHLADQRFSIRQRKCT